MTNMIYLLSWVTFQHWFLQNTDVWKIVEVGTRRKGRMFVDVETQRVCLS